MSGPRTLEPAAPCVCAVADSRASTRCCVHRGNAADLCFDKVVRKCTSFVIACEAYDTEVRGNLFCLGDLTAEEMVARKTQRLPLEVRKSIAFLRIWVRRNPPESSKRTHRTPSAPPLHRPQ